MSRRPYLLAAPATLLVVGLLLGPAILLVRISLCAAPQGRGFFTPGTWTLENYRTITDADGLQRVAETFAFGLGVAALTLAIAYPLALFIWSLSPTGRRLALGLVLLPKFANGLVLLFGLQQLLGPVGPISQAIATFGEPPLLTRNWFGALIGETYLIVPYAVLLLVEQLSRLDANLVLAARGLGASRWQAFRRIVWPHSTPGLWLAGELAAIWGIGAFLGPMILGGPANATLAVDLHRQAFDYGRWPRAAAEAILLIGTAILALIVAAGLRRWRAA